MSYGRVIGDDFQEYQARKCQRWAENKLNCQYMGHTVENFTTESFADRRLGKVIQGLRPGEYLLAWKWHHIFNSADDCFQCYSWCKIYNIEIVIIDTLYLSITVPEQKLYDHCQTAYHIHAEFCRHHKKTDRTPHGWKRGPEGELLPDPEFRKKAMALLRRRQQRRPSWVDLAKWANRKQLFGRDISRDEAAAYVAAARARFPGPNGEVIESIEGAGF